MLEYEENFDSSFQVDYRGDYYTFDYWTRDKEKELMAEATLDNGSGGSSGDFGPVAVPLTASEAATVPA